MASGPDPSDDFVRRFARLEEEVRKLRIRPKAHTETKTYIVGGDIDTGLYVPPVFINVDPDEESPEWKRLVSFHGILATGEISVRWELNGDVVVDSHVIDDTGSTGGTAADVRDYLDPDPPPLLIGENWLQVVVESGTGTELSATFTIITGR